MALAPLRIDERFLPNRDGWMLHLKRTVAEGRPLEARRPVLIVPGYGMNAFLFGFHPDGRSLERSLAEAGLEVFSVNLRGQRPSRPLGPGSAPPSLRALAEEDLEAAIAGTLAESRTGAQDVVVIGCSLGGSLAYAHMALRPDHRIGALVAMGSPLRWETIHPLLKMAFRSPELVGSIPIVGTRRLVKAAVPLVKRVPGALDFYMNTQHVDLRFLKDMTQTVEDPHPRVNKDIARWMNARDMVLRGVNVSEALAQARQPLLVVTANRDGIVPQRAALSALDAWGGTDKDAWEFGDADTWFAHADLFVGRTTPEVVFAPLISWLREYAG